MSPSGLGERLKPFVFLDLFDYEGAPFNADLHPHSGIATLTYAVEGEVSCVDPGYVRGTVPAGGVEWMQAGRACGTEGVSTKQAERAASSCGAAQCTVRLCPSRINQIAPFLNFPQ
jgi:redox-sensitive bicupin YhaK (pirin superfamily)